MRFASSAAALVAQQVVGGREMRMLARVAGQDEEIEYLARGKDSRGTRLLVVCTDRRMIQLRRRLFGLRASELAYADLRRPTYTVARGVGEVRADSTGGGLHLRGLSEEVTRTMYNALEAHLPDEAAIRSL